MSSAALRIVLPAEAAGLAEPAPPPLPVALEPPALPPRVKRGKDTRRVERVREVAGEVEALRPVLRQAVEQYEQRIAAQLTEIVRALHGESYVLPRIPSVKTTSAMLRALRSVELKPARGRAKDLVRLHELVAELTELLTPET